MLRRILGYAALVMTVTLACTGNTRINGDARPVGKGKAWYWMESDVASNWKAVGVTLTESALVDLPGAYDEIELPLPEEAGVRPFEAVVLGWDPLGHDPAPYAVPHLDFLFFFLNSEELGMIQPGPDSVPVDARYRPADYMGKLAEPTVGVHWGDTLAPEMHGKQFGATFVWGFSGGKTAFLEPMIAKSYLETKPSLSEPVKQPAEYERDGYYPTRYEVKYDPKTRTYTVALEGLVRRERAK